MHYEVTDTVMSVVPIDEIMTQWDSVDAQSYGVSLEEMLRSKRLDEHYPAVVESLRTHGWTKGLRCSSWATDRRRTIADGHHRLAAAIDLGWKFVPVEMASWADDDSGTWGKKKPAWY